RQNTAECAKIPGKDGGPPQNLPAGSSSLHPAAHAQQATLCSSAQRGWIRRARRVFAVRRRLLNGSSGCDALTSLLSAMQAERRRRRQPIRQDCERLAAGTTDSASHPNVFVVFIVGLAGT